MSGSGKRGFTLIELLLILAFLGVVAAIMAPTYMKYVKRSRAIVTLSSVKGALQILAKDTGKWPGGAPLI